jgi:hypothetical protein
MRRLADRCLPAGLDFVYEIGVTADAARLDTTGTAILELLNYCFCRTLRETHKRSHVPADRTGHDGESMLGLHVRIMLELPTGQ